MRGALTPISASFTPRGGILLALTTPEGRCRAIAIVPAEEATSWIAADGTELRRRLGQRDSQCGDLAVEAADRTSIV